MQPLLARGTAATVRRLLKVRRLVQQQKVLRLTLRLQGILLSLGGLKTSNIARRLGVHRSTVALWIGHWNEHGEEGLWEGYRSGRPSSLSLQQRETLRAILERGPSAYRLETKTWTAPLIQKVIRDDFGQTYHLGHVRKLLRQLGFTLQSPAMRLVQTQVGRKRQWVRYTFPNLRKLPKLTGGLRSVADPALDCPGTAMERRFQGTGNPRPAVVLPADRSFA